MDGSENTVGMASSILVEYRRVYGLVKIYPLNIGADLLCKIKGTKTLSEVDLNLAEQLGLDIHRRGEEPWKVAV